MKDQNSEQQELIKLWTEMGASTGSLLGRFIGVGAVMGLEAISMVNRPLNEGLREMEQRSDH